MNKQRISTSPVDVVIDELYHQQIPIETPELISTKLKELDEELSRIPQEDKSDWLLAMDKCPDLVGDDKFRLIFLRCEVFNCTKAAKRMVKYSRKRVKLFGISDAFRPLELSEKGPLRNDLQSLEIGFFRATDKKDPSGRSIVFCDPSRLSIDHSKYDNESVVRATWYVAHAVLEDATTQRKGAVIIIHPQNMRFAQFNPTLAKLFAESFKGCIPIRLSALHFCHLPTIFDLIFPFLKMLMGSHLRKKIYLNSGEKSRVLDLFEEKFGISKQHLPIEIGGSLVLNQEKWIKERIEKEC